jgi:hypothetical protein
MLERSWLGLHKLMLIIEICRLIHCKVHIVISLAAGTKEGDPAPVALLSFIAIKIL